MIAPGTISLVSFMLNSSNNRVQISNTVVSLTHGILEGGLLVIIKINAVINPDILNFPLLELFDLHAVYGSNL